MFEFNPELIEGDDDEADDVAYQHDRRDNEDVCSLCLRITYQCVVKPLTPTVATWVQL